MWPILLNNMKDAMSFLNAQSDYFGSCGEHIADNIELSLNFRWDMSRAREMCIAHQNPDTFNLIVSNFTFFSFCLLYRKYRGDIYPYRNIECVCLVVIVILCV